METAFTPWASLAGGGLIGLSAVLLMLTLGRVMGATGLLAGLLLPSSRSDATWRAVLMAGMVSGPLVYWMMTGALPAVEIPVSSAAILVGGVLVGIGVTFGAGCTSGHGVCGMARLSPRSIAATLTFMIFTFATVYILRHGFGG